MQMMLGCKASKGWFRSENGGRGGLSKEVGGGRGMGYFFSWAPKSPPRTAEGRKSRIERTNRLAHTDVQEVAPQSTQG